MLVLAPITRPWSQGIWRTHRPAPSYYKRYRNCLRWDFGFTCAFCLLHEADLSVHGISGSGLGTIEHHLPKSQVPDKANDYANCFYACRYCNQARGNKPNADEAGSELLHPCASTWSDHFILEEDELRSSTKNGSYTRDAYDINEPRRTAMRQDRREHLAEALDVFQHAPGIINRLLTCATEGGEDRDAITSAAERLRTAWLWACRTLKRFSVTPRDHPEDCSCGVRLNLPSHVADQSVEVSSIAITAR